MDIRLAGSPLSTPTPPPAPREREVKPEAEPTADVYNGSRTLANYVSGAVVGAATETLTATAQSPLLAWKMVSNLWKAETLGPNLKTLGTIAAVPAAVVSIGVAPLYGLFHGASQARDRSHGPLVVDTNTKVAGELTTAKADGEPLTMSGKWMKSLDELGARKLEPGEKPHDVPLLSPLFALAGGAVSGVIGGGVGLVAGLAAGSIAGVKDVFTALTAKDMTFGQRAGKILTSPLNLFVGPVLAWKSIKEAVPRGLSDGWKHGLVKPIADTVRISGTLGASVIREAWEK